MALKPPLWFGKTPKVDQTQITHWHHESLRKRLMHLANN